MKETIVAPATPIGRGGVGVVRISGPNVKSIATQIIGKLPEPRYAHYGEFKDLNGDLIDEGLALFFPNPHSFTGEDVLELQGHGGPVIMDMLVQAIIQMGARMARPGEFSERAFLNDKMDLVQAEAIADLIDASSQKSAKSALNSLKGAFSEQIQLLLTQLIDVRTYVEAAIDFPEEEIDFLTEGKVAEQVKGVLNCLDSVQNQANQGRILKDGMKIVILGKPNAGKSSLLNALSGEDSAIVTDVPGTTRDILKEHLQINGMPVHVIDTAGLRATDDKVEAIGVDRALKVAADADRLLVVMDVADETALNDLQSEFKALFELNIPITSIYNKIDLKTQQRHPDDVHSQDRHPDDAQHPSGPIRQKHQSKIDPNAKLSLCQDDAGRTLYLSAKTGEGIEDLKTHLQTVMGFEQYTDGTFSARRRHLEALTKAREHIVVGLEKVEKSRAGELLAEELRLAQNHLSEITGEFRADDLLGVIFSSFCIGK